MHSYLLICDLEFCVEESPVKTVKMQTEVKRMVELSGMKPTETRRILKNVVVFGLAFMMLYTAYNGAANLQSSINAEAGLGTASLAAVYAGLIFSNLFLPVIIIKWLGTKWTICICIVAYMPYIVAQLKPSFYTLVPVGLIVGLGAGPLLCAKCTYLVTVSEAHSKISKIPAEALLVRFLGLINMIQDINQIWGNLISSLVISSGHNAAAVTSLNATLIPEMCGVNFLPAVNAKVALKPQPPEKIQMMAGIYLACMAAALLIVAFAVDSTKRYDSERKPEVGSSGVALLVVNLRLMVEPNHMLLIIINIFSGYEHGFFLADMNAAFVSCAMGTGSVGFVMLAFGLGNAAGSVATGYLAKVTGRLPIICAATLIHASLFITILIWRPYAGVSYELYIIAVLWGLCDSIWIVQLLGYYGVLFPGRETAAFSILHLWKSIGAIIAYVISPVLRTSSKTYLMMAMMVAGVIGYLIVEVRERRAKMIEITKKNLTEFTNAKGCENGFQCVESNK